MDLNEIVVATGNAHKLEELNALWAAAWKSAGASSPPATLKKLPVTHKSSLPEETGNTYAANARLKAEAVSAALGLPALADDSGLEVDGLGGAPGLFSARYAGEGATDEANRKKLLLTAQDLGIEQRHCRFVCALCLVIPHVGKDSVMIEAEGAVEGTLLDNERGKGGFGYDPLFWVPQLGKSMAECSAAEKNLISHRAQAVGNLIKLIKASGA